MRTGPGCLDSSKGNDSSPSNTREAYSTLVPVASNEPREDVPKALINFRIGGPAVYCAQRSEGSAWPKIRLCGRAFGEQTTKPLVIDWGGSDSGRLIWPAPPHPIAQRD
jgi:hypothetical protein